MNFCKLFMFALIVILLASCSSVSQRSTEKAASTDRFTPTEVLFSSDYYLDKAAQAYTKTGDISLRNQWLLKAAESFQLEDDCLKSIKLLRVIESELQGNLQQTQNKLIRAECYLRLPTPAVQQAQRLIPQITRDLGFDKRIHRLQVQLFRHQLQWLKAANAVLLTASEPDEQSNEIWGLLQSLSLAQLEEARLREGQLQAWLQLSIIVRRFGLLPEELSYAVLEWQSRFLNHPLSQTLPPEISQALSLQPLSAARIAVLLPLSGRLASQGLAIKEGILAAYLNNLDKVRLPVSVIVPQPNSALLRTPLNEALPATNTTLATEYVLQQIRFFDSNLKTPEEMNALVGDSDFVIGPLLKEKVSGLLKLLPTEKPILALNRVEQGPKIAELLQQKTVQREAYYFALDPEDEAQHLARHIRDNGFKRPIIFTANGSTTQRMANAFVKEWQAIDDSSLYIAPDLATFTSSKDMREQVSELLDVTQSKKRIKQLENLTTQEVFGVERNRRDIDAIVLFANPEQTELLNPIIESSLSPFTRQTLAVFASSRSYSMNLSKNNLRDLRNLTFSDMPWMLPDHPWSELATQARNLWPQRQDTLMRLFAMGYDAYQLLPKLRHMHLLPQNSMQGLTGELSMDSEAQLHRRLPWAQINQDRVSLLAMD